MSSPYLIIEDLHKEFPRPGERPLKVISGLNVSVEEGALLSILGPSGCGKSTLLNIINGLDSATSGRVVVNGKEVGIKERSQVRIGVVFQQPRLLNWRTVRDNVRIPLNELGIPKEEAAERVEKYLKLVGLGEFMDYYPLQLSGGMQQRVSLARGLAIEPDLRSRARWCRALRCSWPMSRSPHSMRFRRASCGRSSSESGRRPGAPFCSSPTTSARQSSCPPGCWSSAPGRLKCSSTCRWTCRIRGRRRMTHCLRSKSE